MRDGLSEDYPTPRAGPSTPRGDFDRFFDDSQFGHAAGVAVRDLSQVDPYVDKTIGAARISGLLDDIADVLPIAKPRPEFRGLLRLQVMAQVCAREPDSVLVWMSG